MKRATDAQKRAMVAIRGFGGEVSRYGSGTGARWVALDQYGGETARFQTRTLDALSARGMLALKRFEYGAAVYGLR